MKLNLLALTCLSGVSILAAGCHTNSLYAGFVQSRQNFDVVDADLTGGLLGWEGENEGSNFSGILEVHRLSDSQENLEVFAFVFGGRYSILKEDRYRLGIQVDVGIGSADLDRLANENELLVAGLACFAEVSLLDSLSLFGSVGGRYYGDTTDPTTCRDGTTSKSTGQGTCSHHGGIEHYNEMIGDSLGLEVIVGLRWNF